MTNIEATYKEWDNVIRCRYDTLFPDVKYTIWDGVFSPLDYFFTPFRILFINREPYDPEFVSYNLVDTIREQINKRETFWAQQRWLKKNIRDMLAVFSLMQHNNIIQFSENQIKEQINSFRKCNVPFEETLLNSAYINVKKSDGKNISNPKDLRKYAQQGLEVLKAQISFFNPSAIVGGNIVDQILDKTNLEWGNNLFLDSKYIKIYQLKISNKIYPFFDTYHLSARNYGGAKISMAKYYTCLVGALKAVAKRYPNYWEERRNLPVFNQVV